MKSLKFFINPEDFVTESSMRIPPFIFDPRSCFILNCLDHCHSEYLDECLVVSFLLFILFSVLSYNFP